LGLTDAVHAQVRVKHGLVGERPGAHLGRRLKVLRVEVTQGGVEPSQPFQDAASYQPQRLQRGRQR
jgi:hypothetical protein